MSIRKEKEIFQDLSDLCISPGYAHVIAYLSYRDNTIYYSEEIKPDDYAHMFSFERLVRTEISTLIGLLVKKEIDLELPSPSEFQNLVDKTESLLKEIHESMMEPLAREFKSGRALEEKSNPFKMGSFLREPIFYGAESAYNFQYRDFSLEKYYSDNAWFIQNKGYSIKDALNVISIIGEIQNDNLTNCLRSMEKMNSESLTILPGFIFTVDDILSHLDIDINTTINILESFTFSDKTQNSNFKSLNEFNSTNAYPLIKINKNQYLLFQGYSLVEALYETPFYWMIADEEYVNVAMSNRGEFTESFSLKRLETVFGPNKVFKNITIYDSKKQKAGEIDVLVKFANRIIILQAKSKRLTIGSRKGNDRCIKNDFKKSVQESYDQGLSCAKLVGNDKYTFRNSKGEKVNISSKISEIYIFCIVSDHYPALSFQAREFLNFETTTQIMPPFIMDIFNLDVMCEFLDSPIVFLNYANRRAQYSDSIQASHELTILSFHLKRNLWLDEEFSMFHLADDISAELDLAMMVRREGMEGKDTPEGILTRLMPTNLGNIIHDIEKIEDPELVDLGFLLCSLHEDTVDEANKVIDHMCTLSKNDGANHDFTFCIADSGLTIHFNNYHVTEALSRLRDHCVKRKYKQKNKSWFGICLRPTNKKLRFGLGLNYKWQFSAEMKSETDCLSDYSSDLSKIKSH